MEQTKTTIEIANDVAQPQDSGSDQELRVLKDLEMVLVGGGDETPSWP